MRMPALIPLPMKERTLSAFGGYEPRENAAENSFSDMCDLSSDMFPLLSSRQKRLRLNISGGENTGGQEYFNGGRLRLVNDSLTAVEVAPLRAVLCTQRYVYAEGEKLSRTVLDDISPEKHKIALFGNDFMVYPEGRYFKAPAEGCTVKRARYKKRFSNVLACVITAQGEDFAFDGFGELLPENPTADTSFVEISETGMRGYVYSNGAWSQGFDLYVMLTASGIDGETDEGDGVYASGITSGKTKCTVYGVLSGRLILQLREKPDTYLLSSGGQMVYTSLTLSRKMPKMDFMCQHGNRLWGCRYGENDNGEFVNEIYASALGDATLWDSFQGISTDSFCASLGCSGEFTGMCSMGGEVLAFKEDYIISIGGSTPSDFTVRAIPARGIRKNASSSLAVLNEKAFYLSESGITVYDGTLPYIVAPLPQEDSYTCKCSRGFKGKYFFALHPASGEDYILVYDTKTGLLHRESDRENTEFFIRVRGELFAVCREESTEEVGVNTYSFWNVCGNKLPPFDIFRLNPPGGIEYTYIEEERDSWYGVMDKIGLSQDSTAIVRGISFRISLGEDSRFTVGIRCNGEEAFKDICTVEKPRKGFFSFRVNTPRCESFELMLKGTGECVVREIKIITEKTSEVTAHG